MLLPKLPTKPAVILSPDDYPKAEQGKPVTPSITLVESAPFVFVFSPAARAKIVEQVPEEKPRGPSKSSKASDPRVKSSTSRKADKLGMTKLFVLDTNVLMHDPTSLFRFAEHDVYLPMMTLEELDDHKKGMSEVARNARQVSRSLDSLVADIDDFTIVEGIPLSMLAILDAMGRLSFQTRLQRDLLPEGLPAGKADNQILGVVSALGHEHPGRPVVLVSK